MSIDIIHDKNDEIALWVCKKLQISQDWLGDNLTFGFYNENKRLGGLIFHDYEPNHSIWWTIYASDKHWCTRRVLQKMFDTAFNELHCRRINLLVCSDNETCLKFVQKLGFKPEGFLRKYLDNGKDCYFFGMLQEECPWL